MASVIIQVRGRRHKGRRRNTEAVAASVRNIARERTKFTSFWLAMFW